MAAAFGLDFGTTNSVAALIGEDIETRRKGPQVLMRDGRPHPSVVSYRTGTPVVGREAKEQLKELGLGVYGDVVRSPKMFLGRTTGILVGGVKRSAVDVSADVLTFICNDARSRGFDNGFTSAVVTIPVSMNGQARAELRQAALKAGLHIRQFVHEPLAALYGFLRGKDDFRQQFAALDRQNVLVFDWGGGTLDLTLCRVEDGRVTQIFNAGDYDVGGDRFDEKIRQLVRSKHESAYPEADWTKLQPSAEPRILAACEDAKIRLSTHMTAAIYVKDVLASSEQDRDIRVEIARGEMTQFVDQLVRTGLGKIDSLLERAGLTRADIEYCLATGGMVSMPAIRQGLHELFGVSRVRLPDNAATLIAEGAAWIAYDETVMHLAKPIELLHADNSFLQVIHAGTALPNEGQTLTQTIDMYCVDPRDGLAKFFLARPTWPGRDSQGDARTPYAHVTLPVDPHAPPLHETLRLQVTVDHNLIANVCARSQVRGEQSSADIHDLEFGMDVSDVLESKFSLHRRP